MKQLKRVSAFILALSIAFGAVMPMASAAKTEEASQLETIWFEDGSRIEKRITTDYSSCSSHTTRGTASASYYSSANKLLVVLNVHGTFTYDGITATATSATYSYQIYESVWNFKSGEAYCSGNQAIAEAAFSGGIFLTRTITAVLSCSPTGTLS